MERTMSEQKYSGTKNVAIYLRVSTIRQAEGEVSIPAQRDYVRQFCVNNDYSIIDEYIEPGASASHGTRPVFEQMLERAHDEDHPYDVIVVYSFSRFYRDGIEMELEIRKLRKKKVEVVSATQPSGDDPMMDLIRQIFSTIDGYIATENSKQVRNAMGQNAKQGFYNGSSLPLGYKTIEAERRGEKVKKKLDINPEGAEVVKLIFTLYVDGNSISDTPPLGIKDVAKFLNSNGYRTQEGNAFSSAAISRILSNTAYIGKYRYNKRNSRTGEYRPDTEVITIPCPPIIDIDTFQRARAKALENRPEQMNSRSSSSPVLLSRIAICGRCGAPMQKSPGTGENREVYHYYVCGTRHRKGATECPGMRIRMDELDQKVIETVSTRLCTTDRLTTMLNGLMQHFSKATASANANLAVAEKTLGVLDEKLRRLHRSIEDGLVPLDEVLRDRITELSGERERAKKLVDRLRKQLTPAQEINHQQIESFSSTFRERLKEGNPVLRRNYLKSVIGAVIVDEEQIRIVGHKLTIAESIGAFSFAPRKVHTFESNWRARRDSNS